MGRQESNQTNKNQSVWLSKVWFTQVQQQDYHLVEISPQSADRNKSRLLFSSAEMFKKPQWQTVWTQIILLL